MLVTSRRLDYDMSNRQFTLRIEVNDSLVANFLTVIIEITDINDNGPRFGNTSYVFEVSEDAVSGYMIGRVEADDIDSGLFGSVRYSLSGDGAEL